MLLWGVGATHFRAVGHDVVFHQCEYGQSLSGLEGLVKKHTQVRTTKWMKTGLRRICSGDHEHTRLEGSRLGGDHRTGRTENYSEKLADKFTELMMADVQCQLRDQHPLRCTDPSSCGGPRHSRHESLRKNVPTSFSLDTTPRKVGCLSRIHLGSAPPGTVIHNTTVNERVLLHSG